MTSELNADRREIARTIQATAEVLHAHPEQALAADSTAVAVLSERLRCRVTGPNGTAWLSDMPKPAGGGASAPTPGWMMRAALASCDATMIALRAAQLDIALHTLEVRVDSHSDSRGVLGTDDTVPAGPLSLRVRVRIGASGVAPQALRELVRWAEQHSPVGDALRRGVAPQMEVELV